MHFYYHLLHIYIQKNAHLWAKVCKKKRMLGCGCGWVEVGVGVGVRMGVSVGGRVGGDRPKNTKNGWNKAQSARVEFWHLWGLKHLEIWQKICKQIKKREKGRKRAIFDISNIFISEKPCKQKSTWLQITRPLLRALIRSHHLAR